MTKINLPVALLSLLAFFTGKLEICGESIDSLFPTLNQEVYAFKDYDFAEINHIGQLPDGRIFCVDRDGKAYAFTNDDWIELPQIFPSEVLDSYIDSRKIFWVWGWDFFGYMDDALNYIDLSNTAFSKPPGEHSGRAEVFETEEWIHFAYASSILHYNRKIKITKITEFDGMYDAYPWVHDNKLFLASKSKIETWENGKFEHYMGWSHESRIRNGWREEGLDYFLTKTHLYVYQDGKHIQTIKDDLMEMIGAATTITNDHVYIYTHQGIIEMDFDGTCRGYFNPWFHQKISVSMIGKFKNFETKDLWLFTDNAILQINFEDSIKYLGVDTGFPLSGGWDIEVYNGDIFTASTQGFEKWQADQQDFVKPEIAPDFQTSNIWEWSQTQKLLISTWWELGSFDGEYTIEHNAEFYSLLTRGSLENTFWAAKNTGAVLLDEDFNKLRVIKGFNAYATSMIEINGNLWAVTVTDRLYRANLDEDHAFTDVTHLLKFAQSELSKLRIFKLEERLYLQSQDQLFELGEQEITKVDIALPEGWIWEIPILTSDDDSVVLVQRNIRQNGCRIGELEIDSNGQLHWNPKYAFLKGERGTLRRVKKMTEFDEDVVAVISPGYIELVKTAELSQSLPKPIPPKFVTPLKDIGKSLGDPQITTYKFNIQNPLTLQLHHSQNTLDRPLSYVARIAGRNQEWKQNKNGTFEFPGVMRGKHTIEAYVVDPYGIKSDAVQHLVKVIPPWYINNAAIGGYVITLGLIIFFSVQVRTRQLRKRSKELEETVEERTKDLMLANQAKSIFVSNVSHEIRNPLNGLLGFVQNMKKGEIIDDETLRRLRRPSFYLYRFLSNVLDFSKFETGGIRLNKRVFDPNELLDSVESMFAGDFQERNLTFVADYRYEHDPFLCASQEAIEMILVNLVGNAVKFTPPGGNIRTAMQYSEGWLTLTVADTGIGISDVIKERIFEPYEQGDQGPLVTGEKGAGIGLSLVKQTAEQLGGYVEVTSEVGKGSTFTASIPVSRSDQSEIPGVVDEVKLKGKFLLVEDLEYNLKLLTDTLTRWGAVVDGVSNGQQALQKVQSTNYDMAIVDYDLPDMNGSQVAGEIRKSQLNAKIPIIGLSAYTDQEFIQKALDGGMNDFQFKPVNVQKLVECIYKFIPEKIQFTLKKKIISENGRTSLKTIKRSGPGGSESLETSAQAYLDQLDKLVKSLNKSDLGSKEFETILHQLKGHSNLIHHRTSSQYWQRISEASKAGERMNALEELDSLHKVVTGMKNQISSLLLLENDFESQSQKRESFNYGSLSYTKESIKY